MDDSEYYSDILDEEDLDSEELEMLDEQNQADSSDSSGDEDENQIDASVLQSAIAMASMATGSAELANNLTVNWGTEAPNSDDDGDDGEDGEDGDDEQVRPAPRRAAPQPGTYALEGGFLTDDEDSNYEEEDDDLLGDMDGFKDALRGMSGIGRQKRGRPSNRHRTKPEAQRLLGMANTLFVDRQLDAAYEVLCEAIRVDANAQEAWYTMALIRDEQGRPDDAVHLYTLAAHLQPSNHELWERLSAMHCEAAERKQALGQASDEDWQAALYCISNAIRNGRRDPELLKRKLALQERTGDTKISRTYRELLRLEPHDLMLVRSAARHAVQSRGDAAAALGWFTAAVSHYNELVRSYTKMYASSELDDGAGGELSEYYRNNRQLTVSMEAVEGYDYSDINMIAELYIMRHAYQDAIAAIKLGARFIQGRGNETTWDSDDLDAEFYQPGGGHELPVELRAKLGQCRLLLGQTEQAHVHLQVVDQQDMGVYADVFLDIGRSMVDVGHAQEAADLLERLRLLPAADTVELWEPLARAYRELGRWEQARACLELVVEARPRDSDARMLLAEVHEELGHVDKAFALLREVEEIQAEDARDQAQQQQQAEQRAAQGLVRRGRRARPAQAQPDSSTERHLALAHKAGLWFAKLAELEPRLGDAAARAEYRQTAYLLYMDWKRVPFFYMADRSRPFRGYRTQAINALENGQAVGDKASMAQRRMARIKKRLAKKTSEDDDLVPTSYLMHSFGEWHDMFLQYARCLAVDGESARALKLLDDVVQCNCFVRDHVRRRTLKTASLVIALRIADHETAYEAVRYIWGSRPAKAAVYRLASYAMCRSSSLSQLMSSPPMYKFMRRQLSLLADGVYGSSDTLPHALAHLPKYADLPDSDAAVGETREGLPLTWRDVAALHAMSANIMAASRTATQAVMQYTLVQALVPEDASAALQLGIAYLVFAIRSDMPNRHRVLMQGFTYLQRYAELRCKQAARNAQRPVPDDMVAIQEIAYNYARAFHSVGAEHLAVDFYERVFELP
ncbi:transcription factor TFIIIC subunit tfc4, partial [Linderina pennispora]